MEEDRNDDSEAGSCRRWIQEFHGAAEVLGEGKTLFEEIHESQEAMCEPPMAPFEDNDEWELARWLIKNVTQTATEEFLKMEGIRSRYHPSYRSNYTFLKKVDQLPTGPEWMCRIIRTVGKLLGEDGGPIIEEHELWIRNPIECVRGLIGNPAFREYMAYAPEKTYADKHGRVRRYDEMWTGDWWWKVQTKLPQGATVSPIILASDKTNLSQFGGDKQAWPVYLTIGNLSKDIRRQPSSHGSVLIGYLPVAKLLNFPESAPAGKAGTDGINMTCADGFVRRVFPILAAFVADHPEQCLIACCKENYCPKCTVKPNDRGEHKNSALRTVPSVKSTLHQKQNGDDPIEFEDEGLREVYSPFWSDLPHCDIFSCISPDILHQLHKGVFKDHSIKWCSAIVGEAAIDDRFRAMSAHPELRHFKKGISSVSQWTGKEHKEMQKVYLGILAGIAPAKVLAAARGLLDFIYYAQYQSHTTEALHHMQKSLDLFHANKNAFVDLDIREHFNFPKLHSMCHYITSIQNLGSIDGLNSEAPERLHIDYAKKGYRASNKNDYIPQMAKWLQRQEAIDLHTAYLRWCSELLPQEDTDHDEDDEEKFISRTIVPNEYDRFDVYNAVHIVLPSRPHISDRKRQKTIHATPEHSNGPRKQASPARFDTALVIEDTDLYREGGLRGLRVAEIRVIFTLPSHLGSFPHPLAYIHWFTPIHVWDDTIGMYRVGRSTRNHRPNAAIISVEQILQSCHLLPRFGSAPVPRSWLNGRVLDMASDFYINRYINFYLFEDLNPSLLHRSSYG
ncbi:hypothetical protein BGY98DRAFT_1089274 [Russula aff. rugulosa BPL654]|nr:hypothetical protein BGY98DRAFT_1089274 [Russula aff. rugulosa BPL654]